jgi:hypothetical protein
MILYVNGDSHSAGAEAVNTYCFASDDPKYKAMRDRPHPDNLEVSFGKKIAAALNCGFATDALSSASNERILRTTKEFVEQKHKSEIFVLVGWSTPEREEWLHEGEYYQINGSGIDSVPDALQDKYKHFVANCDKEHYGQKIRYWENRIFDFHQQLLDQNIKHLFFNTFTPLYLDKNWYGCFVDDVYCDWLKTQGYKTRHLDTFHFGKDAHTAWAKHLIPYIRKQL